MRPGVNLVIFYIFGPVLWRSPPSCTRDRPIFQGFSRVWVPRLLRTISRTSASPHAQGTQFPPQKGVNVAGPTLLPQKGQLVFLRLASIWELD